MTKYEMVARIKMVMEGEFTVASLQSVVDALNDEINTDLNKKIGTSQKNLLKACKNVLKNGEKLAKKAVHGSWIVNDVQYMTDGYRIIINRTPLALRELDKDITPIDVEKVIKNNEEIYDVELPLPSLEELTSDVKRLKADMKTRKIKDGRIAYSIKCNGVIYCVNAEYLLDGILATGAKYAKIKENGSRYPLYLEGNDADYLLLPINTACEKTGAYIA
jgi:hypothetical protein